MARAISREFAIRAEREDSRRDRLFAASIRARVALAEADTAEAIDVLRDLTPTARRDQLAWNLWEPLGFERAKLSELLLARGELAEALRVASNIDSPQAAVLLMYLPTSLSVRLAVARSLGAMSRVESYNARLKKLDRTDLMAPG